MSGGYDFSKIDWDLPFGEVDEEDLARYRPPSPEEDAAEEALEYWNKVNNGRQHWGQTDTEKGAKGSWSDE